MKILKEIGIPDHLTCLLRNLYAIWLLDILQSASKFQGPRRDELLVLRHVTGKAIREGLEEVEG